MEIFLFCLCTILLIVFWFIIFDSNRFVTVNYRIENEKIKKPLSFIFVSDLHNKKYGKNNEKLISAIKKRNPDYIIIGGDLINAKPGADLQTGIQFIKDIDEFPVYYANGNHEHRLKLYPENYGDMHETYEKELENLKVKRLINDKVVWNDYNLSLYGSQIDRLYYKRFVIPRMEDGYLDSILGTPKKERFNILLAHNPDYFENYSKWGADLVLSGHVHGGIVRVPFWKGVLSPNIRFFPKYDGGIFKNENSTMILSRGLGMHTIPLRLFNPGELVFVELAPKFNEEV